jgi:TetR/AcrR family transcriptional regulator
MGLPRAAGQSSPFDSPGRDDAASISQGAAIIFLVTLELTVQRDPERTQRRILAAAEKEFSAKGFAGARVDAIARRARVNKRMLYHYFGKKEGLFREILRRKMTQPDSPFRTPELDDSSLGDRWVHFYETSARNVDFFRLLEWEALSAGERPVLGEEERRADEEDGVARVRHSQDAGRLPADLDPAHLLLTFVAINAFPVAFPQMARLITGLAPSDPRFRRQRIEFLRGFARCIEACAG